MSQYRKLPLPKRPKASVTNPRFVYGPLEDTINCSGCGWPLKAVPGSPLYVGKNAEGERKYKHFLCPTSRQRAALRAAALVQS